MSKNYTNTQIEESKSSILDAKFETIRFVSKFLCHFLKTKDTHYLGHEFTCYIPTRRTNYLLPIPRPKIKIKIAKRQKIIWKPGRGNIVIERLLPNRIKYPLFCDMEDANKKLYLLGEIVSRVSEHVGNSFTPYQEAEYRDDKELSDLVREFQEKI